MTEPSIDATRGRRLARSALWSLLGQLGPLVVALVCIPLLVRALGTERYGTVTLFWVTLAYFNILDLGLSRALMQALAERAAGAADAVWTTAAAVVGMGILGAVGVAAAAHPLVYHVLEIPPALREEAVNAIRVLAIALPFVTLAGTAGAVLQAGQRFGVHTAITLPATALNYAAPLVVSLVTHNLAAIAGATVGVRAAMCCALLIAARPGRFSVRLATLKPLLKFGGWFTLSMVATAFLVNFDRLVIAATISMAATAYYATPYDMITRIGLIPGALVGVLFPAFAATHAENPARARLLFVRGTNYVLLSVLPISLAVLALSHEILQVWIGSAFADNGAGVLRWLAAGALVNAMAYLPSAALQGAGRADLTAKAHAVELPLYLAALWWLVSTRGIEGAAIAWVGRVALDAALLYAFALRLLPGLARELARPMAGAAIGLASLAVPLLLRDTWSRCVYLAAAVPLILAAGWWLLLTREERAFFRGGAAER